MKKKLFISHASEDKDDFVRPMAEALTKDYEVWYDEYQLVMGANLLEAIDRGLSACDYGVVVLSKDFFSKKWPQAELNALFALEEKDRKVILPVWKGMDAEEVKKYSPILAGRVAARSDDGIEKVVTEIGRAISFFERGRTVEVAHIGKQHLRASIAAASEYSRSKQIVNSEAGVSVVAEAVKQIIDSLAANIRALVESAGHLDFYDNGPSGNHINYSYMVCLGQKCLALRYYNRIANSASQAKLSVETFLNDDNPWRAFRSVETLQEIDYEPFIDKQDNVKWVHGTDMPKSAEECEGEIMVAYAQVMGEKDR